MRILVINYEYPPIGGGGGFVTRDIFEHIVGLGHGATVITSSYKGLKRRERVNGVEIIRVPVFFRKNIEVANTPSMLSYLPSSLLEAVFHLKRRMYDIINTHFAIPSGPTGYALAHIHRRPNVLSIHGGDIFDPSKPRSPHKTPLLANTVSWMLKTADRIVAQSNDTKINAKKYYDIKRHIDVIPLGIKKPVFEKKLRQDFDIGFEDRVFCTIGRLVSRKNIEEILAILSELKDNYTFKFLIIGEGPQRLHLEKLAEGYGLNGLVRFLGNVSDEVKFQILNLSDCYLSTASHEGFGLVFLEAMECGLPILCYNRGGQTDFLVNGKTGFLVELNDKKAFRNKLVELITNPELIDQFSLYNKQLAKEFYISGCAEKYIALFQEVISTWQKHS